MNEAGRYGSANLCDVIFRQITVDRCFSIKDLLFFQK